MSNPFAFDPICLIHGCKASEHDCLYCCFCYRPLTPAECHALPDGTREDVCEGCAALEAKRIAARAEGAK